MPEHKLKLKVDTVVILLRNMDINGGHCNGTRYLVKYIGEYRLVLHKLDQQSTGTISHNMWHLASKKNVWTHGQIYVAFSRFGNPNNLYVWAEQSQFEDYKLVRGEKYVKHIVY